MSAPGWDTLPIWTYLPSHASVVQPPTSLWSEGACPVCTSLDQWHMGQTCVVFPGAGRVKKRRGQQAAVLAGDSGLGCAGEPLIGRPSTLAVSDLETSSSGAKAQTLRCDFEGLRAPSPLAYLGGGTRRS